MEKPVLSQPSEIYIDVKPANTTRHLEIIRSLPISVYQFVHERAGSGKRSRVGPLGHAIIATVPEVVDIVSERVLPPSEKGGDPIVLRDFPVIDDQKLFMYGIGGLQELAKLGDFLQTKLSLQIEAIQKLHDELSKVERFMNITRSTSSEIRKKKAEVEIEKLRLSMELDIQRVKDEEEYANLLVKLESTQMEKNEELLKARLTREEVAARQRSDVLMQKKIETSMLIEQERAKAADAVSAIQNERVLKVQEANERLKAETANTIARTKAEMERLNEDIHLRRLKAEANQKRMRNIAAIESVYENIAKSLTSAMECPDKILKFISYASLLTAALFLTREGAKLCRSVIEAAIGRPKLIRETTQRPMLITWINTAFEIIGRIVSRESNNNSIASKCHTIFDDLVLPEKLKNRVVNFSISAAKARHNKAPNRHLLLYGQPGTGKTFVAR